MFACSRAPYAQKRAIPLITTASVAAASLVMAYGLSSAREMITRPRQFDTLPIDRLSQFPDEARPWRKTESAISKMMGGRGGSDRSRQHRS